MAVSRWFVALVLAMATFLAVLFGAAPVASQTFPDVAAAVYAAMPELPLENHYQQAGVTQPENTLIFRFLHYHQRLKRRSPLFRLDWKLTLADYLGANETINPEQYPFARQLQPEPSSADRAALNRLNQSQRETLVNLLVRLYDGPAAQPPAPQPEPTPTPTPPTPTPSEFPQPGDSRLLL
ncbi:hypothetical protein VB712_16825 [Spirulina sp. CCNP1310]|uniref:hypothetical protein n=1 Tax=Spirulina sp. CCNP1310 TaxID=3110249 RepID=UPI002B21F5AE|nr:hypothetical protein [Spirulina sp. CCNP1310]MEA5420895.1 hypothetical protein [Spirulina sp. CCNP1310]